MRDLVVFVADSTMEQAFLSFMTRHDFHAPYNLNIHPISFDPAEDLIRIPGNDSGAYGKGHEWMRARLGKYRHGIVVFDREFGTDLDAQTLSIDLTSRIAQTGWHLDHFRVVVIEPELEAWIWQRNQRVAVPLGFKTVDQLVASVCNAGLAWPEGQPKPSRPKEALEAVCRLKGIGFSAALHRSITASVSLIGCQDPSFVQLRAALQRWFPNGGAA